MQIKGTYDVLLIPHLLPVSYLLQTVPPAVRNIQPSPLLPFTQDQISALGLNASNYDLSTHHPVVFELGYQQNSGPPPFGLNFEEAKMEIIGMRHPDAPQGAPLEAERGFVYKQLILFSSSLLTASSNWIAGLRSIRTPISPPKTPASYEPDYQGQVFYKVANYLEATLDRQADPDSSHAAELISWAGRPWYGASTAKDTLTQFNFDLSTQPFEPIAYQGQLRMRREAFLDPSSAKEAVKGVPAGEWSEFTVKGWRFKASYASQDSKVEDNL